MKRINLILFLMSATLIATNWSCSAELFDDCISGKGDKETRIIELNIISGFDLSGAMELTIIEATDEQIIEVTSYPNLIELLIEGSFIDNEIWIVGIDGCIGIRKSDIEIRATISALKGISISGSGDVKTEGGIFENVDDLILNVSGSGDIDLELGTNINSISTSVSGSGDFSIEGQAKKQNITISGEGDVKAYDLITEDSDISISGSGDCKVHAANTLSVKISGSGDVCYKGNPTVSSNISGSGSVRDCN